MPLFEPFYKEYPRCLRKAPLSCDQPQETVRQLPGAKFCLECRFPATLPEKAEIQGSRGTYQVKKLLGSRGMGRLYSGIQLNDSQPVVIKEYLLPALDPNGRFGCFNAKETHDRKETFKRVAGVSPADGRIQDFRLISPSDAIADQQGERCYLVTKGDLEVRSVTLRRYLMEKGAMTAPQVREVLNQALQTLQFLHTQKLRLPSGQVQQGLTHGNLSLDSLLILEQEQQFYIYLCDLASWERLFDPPSAQPSSPTKPKQDLEALGLVAFYLWVGWAPNQTSGQPPDPKDSQQWPNSDNDLKEFIDSLIGPDTRFDSAEAARQALLKLPKEDQANSSLPSVVPEPKEKGLRTLLLILGVVASLLVGGGMWYFLSRGSGSQQNDLRAFNVAPSFNDVSGVPSGDFTYTGQSDGTWSSVLDTKPESEQTLEELLTKPKPDAQFSYKPVPSPDIGTDPIEAVRTGKAYFAIASPVDKLTDDLDSKRIAYDGLLVFVAFSKKEYNLPKALDGKISLDQLRQLYTGQITDWREIIGSNFLAHPLRVELDAPTEPEARRQFEHLVLKDDPQQIAFFESQKVHKLSTAQTQRQIVPAFDNEQPVGIISFGILSKTWDQCAGYPLALVDGNKPPSQALLRLNGQPIQPSDNLCDKNNRLDIQTFVKGNYPLGYPLVVVYPKDNSRPLAGPKFAELLTTRQGQCLLRKTGLVPLQPIPENQQKSNGCESLP